MLDIGGESTRPGSRAIGAEEELRRRHPGARRPGATGYPLPISIDTSKPQVARAALERGAAFVNDVRALRDDAGRWPPTRPQFGAGLSSCTCAGSPGTMQTIPRSPDILVELELWAEEAVARARNCGVSSEKIILDPGIGFGKSVAQNLEILRNLDRLAATGFPLLVGTSRKSFIGAILKDPEADRIWGTAATVAASIMCGAHIVRVHDVGPMRDIARVADALTARGNRRVNEVLATTNTFLFAAGFLAWIGTWQQYIRDIIDIALVAYILYRFLLLVRGTRGAQMTVGMVVLLGFYYATRFYRLTTVQWLLNNLLDLRRVRHHRAVPERDPPRPGRARDDFDSSAGTGSRTRSRDSTRSSWPRPRWRRRRSARWSSSNGTSACATTPRAGSPSTRSSPTTCW